MKVYIVMLRYSTEESSGTEIEAFGSYERAVERFNELIENEKKPEASWVSYAFEGAVINEKSYTLDCSPKYEEGEEHELWWEVSCKMDWCYRTGIELVIREVM